MGVRVCTLVRSCVRAFERSCVRPALCLLARSSYRTTRREAERASQPARQPASQPGSAGAAAPFCSPRSSSCQMHLLVVVVVVVLAGVAVERWRQRPILLRNFSERCNVRTCAALWCKKDGISHDAHSFVGWLVGSPSEHSRCPTLYCCCVAFRILIVYDDQILAKAPIVRGPAYEGTDCLLYTSPSPRDRG